MDEEEAEIIKAALGGFYYLNLPVSNSLVTTAM
jgi:hypothetical protein